MSCSLYFHDLVQNMISFQSEKKSIKLFPSVKKNYIDICALKLFRIFIQIHGIKFAVKISAYFSRYILNIFIYCKSHIFKLHKKEVIFFKSLC